MLTSVGTQISDTVYPMYKAFIEPDLAKAHLRISNNFNPFSGFMDATYILKSAKHVTVEDIHAALPVSLRHSFRPFGLEVLKQERS